MPSTINGQTQNWFSVSESLSKDVTADTDIDVTKISAVYFNIDVELKLGSLTETLTLVASTPIAMDEETTVIQVDSTCFMFAMGGR